MKLSQLFLTLALLITTAFTIPVVKERAIVGGDIARLDIGNNPLDVGKLCVLLFEASISSRVNIVQIVVGIERERAIAVSDAARLDVGKLVFLFSKCPVPSC
jgi:hypothetical protein